MWGTKISDCVLSGFRGREEGDRKTRGREIAPQ